MELTLEIKKSLIRDYLGYLFPRDEAGRYLVTRKIAAGHYICSMVEYAHKPPHSRGSIVMLLPACPALKSGATRFLYMSAETQAKVNDYLEVVFDLDFERYMLKGEQMGIPQKDIIYAFINSRGLASFDQDPETLKKRAYRQSTRQMQSIVKQLLNKADYTNRIISEQIKAVEI